MRRLAVVDLLELLGVDDREGADHGVEVVPVLVEAVHLVVAARAVGEDKAAPVHVAALGALRVRSEAALLFAASPRVARTRGS